MKAKENGCYSITKAELLDSMRAGGLLRWWDSLGPYIFIGSHECHPRGPTVRRLINEGRIVESKDANPIQRKSGLKTYRIADSPEAAKEG